MDEARSAVVVPIAVPWAVEAIRRRHVPVATRGVPPHVTVLSPFVPASRLEPAVRDRLARIAAATPAFRIRFARVERFPDALYLDPEPSEPFRRLIVDVCRAFPANPPYGDPAYQADDVVPHLTIAIGDGSGFDELAAAAAGSLPFDRGVDHVTVVAEDRDGDWRTRWRLALRR